MKIQTLLQIAALLQASVALLNLGLIHILKWKPDLERMSLLVREVFQIHVWFISITLFIFAALTWRFAPELSTGSMEIYRWLAVAIGIFWGIRAVLQFTWYSSSHWKGQAGRTIIHILLISTYGGFALTYLYAALGGRYGCLF